MAFFRQLIDLGHGSTVAAPVNGSRRTEGTRNNSRGSIALAISRFASGENRALKLRFWSFKVANIDKFAIRTSRGKPAWFLLEIVRFRSSGRATEFQGA
jgi:hypothetical protein